MGTIKLCLLQANSCFESAVTAKSDAKAWCDAFGRDETCVQCYNTDSQCIASFLAEPAEAVSKIAGLTSFDTVNSWRAFPLALPYQEL